MRHSEGVKEHKGVLIAVALVAAVVGWFWWDSEQSSREIDRHYADQLRDACDRLYLIEGEAFTVAANSGVADEFAVAVHAVNVDPDPSVSRLVALTDRVGELYINNRPQGWDAGEVAEVEAVLDELPGVLRAARQEYC
jgi:hypothetical protein